MKTNNKRKIRITVLTAILCLTLCTAAVFAVKGTTKSIKASVNTVESGTLDVTLEMCENNSWVNAEGATLEFVSDSQPVYWEPGCTHDLPALRICNNGTLDLSYTVEISGLDGDSKLNEVIGWYYVTDNSEEEFVTISGTLAAGETSDPFTIRGTMDLDASNDYQGLTIEGISINVTASQATLYEGEGSEESGAAYYTINTDEDLVIDEKGKCIVFNDNEQNYIASEDGQEITLSNATYTGTTEAFLFGQYRGPKYCNYNNIVNNINVINLKVTNGVSNGSDKVSNGVYAYGNSEFNNCVMTGTTSTAEGYGVYDLGITNGSKCTINDGRYGAIYVWSQAHVTINDAEVDKIVCSTITTRNLGMLTISDGTHVRSIELTCSSKYTPALTIEDGAVVDEIIYKGVTYTQDEWINNNPL